MAIRRWRVLVSDIFIEETDIIVEADSPEEAEHLADELVAVGDGLPAAQHRQFDVWLEEERDDDSGDP